MKTANELFDLDPFTNHRAKTHRPRHRRTTSLTPSVAAALVRLKGTLDSLPPEELERRRNTAESVLAGRDGYRRGK